MTEFEDAMKLAERILERPYADPDDDLAVLSRQLLRLRERLLTADRLKYEAALHSVKELVAALDSRGPANDKQLRALRNGRSFLAAMGAESHDGV